MTYQTPYNAGYNNQPPQQQYGAPPGPPPVYGNEQQYGNAGYYGQQNGVAQPANTYQK